MLGHYSGSLVRALDRLFPAIHIDKFKFPMPRTLFYFIKSVFALLIYILILFAGHYWQNIDNQKKLFFDFANAHNFNPLLPNNWYSQPLEKIKVRKSTAILVRRK